MAATPSGIDYAAPASRSQGGHRARQTRDTPLVVRAGCVAAALICIAVGLTIASAYPVLPYAVMGLFVIWSVFGTVRFAWAWPAAIALVPAIAFATWTGWLAFEEVDLLILATVAGGYAAWALAPRHAEDRVRSDAPALSLVSRALVFLFLASSAIALVRGIDAAGGLRLDRFDWSAQYDSAQNSVRLFKSFAFATLIWPLLQREWRTPDGLDRLGTALTVALGLCGLVVLQERAAFPGLLSFSEDYRVTGPFWEMHMGGAALDGFLTLTIPFAVREVLRQADRWRVVLAMVVLALASYAALVTFSRGVYAAVPLSLLVLFALIARQRSKAERGAAWTSIAKAIVFAIVVAVGGAVVFHHGGYRAALAAFLVLAFAIPVDGALRRLPFAALATAIGIALALSVIGFAAAELLPKGAYLVYTAAFLATAAAAFQGERSSARSAAMLMVAAWLWLSASAVSVARFWGGSVAFVDSAAVLAGFVVVVFVASRLTRSIWPPARRDRLVTVAIAAVVLGTVTVFAAGSYMGGRFSTSNNDMQYRLKHWRNGIDRLHGLDWLLGKGLGRFPATSLYEPPDSGGQGLDRLVQSNGETYVELAAPHVRYLGFYELFRMSQRVVVRPHTPYVATVVARMAAGAGIHIEVCERHLLYVGSCQVADLGAQTDASQPTSSRDPTWQTYRFAFNSGSLGDSTWLAPRPVVLALATETVVDVRSAHLVGPDGVDLIANPDFRDRMSHWFSSSDRYHLPWHIKNLALAVLFDQGIPGLALFALLAGGAFLRTSFGRAYRHPDAPFVAAAIVGYAVVGGFDSLLDVPRVAFLFYLVVLLGLMLRNPRLPGATRPMVRAGVQAPMPVPAAPTDAAVPMDAAAERARRRQQAFGTRKRPDA